MRLFPLGTVFVWEADNTWDVPNLERTNCPYRRSKERDWQTGKDTNIYNLNLYQNSLKQLKIQRTDRKFKAELQNFDQGKTTLYLKDGQKLRQMSLFPLGIVFVWETIRGFETYLILNRQIVHISEVINSLRIETDRPKKRQIYTIRIYIRTVRNIIKFLYKTVISSVRPR